MRVSFVIPTHNCAAWLPLAVKSVLEQSHKDVECVIVDDASTDTTSLYLAWLEAQKDPRVKIVRSAENVGRSAARNMGNDASTGDIICVLDADDLAMPDRAKLTIGVMNKTKAPFVYGSARLINSIGQQGQEIRCDVFDKAKALKHLTNGIVHSTVAYTRDIALTYPYHTGSYSDLGIDDWHQQIRLALDGVKMEPIPAVVSCYRDLSTGVSATRDQVKVREAKLTFLEERKVCRGGEPDPSAPAAHPKSPAGTAPSTVPAGRFGGEE